MIADLPPFPTYERVTRIEAARITGYALLARGKVGLALDIGQEAGSAYLEVTASFARLHKPSVGDWIIKHETGIRSVSGERFAAWYQPALPELESMPSMKPQAFVIARDVPPVPKAERELTTRNLMDMVLGKA